MPDHLAARIETAPGRRVRPPDGRRARAGPRPAPRGSAVRPADGPASGRRSGLPRWVVTDERARRHARRPGLARGILTAVATVAILGGGGYALFATQGNGSGSAATRQRVQRLAFGRQPGGR